MEINGIIPVSSHKLKVMYIMAEYDPVNNIYIDVEKEMIINPLKSALVVIDIWEQKWLNNMTINFINPLIKDLHGYGVKIIYSPSQKKQNKNLFILDEAITFYNIEIMDEFLYNHKIETLLYVGSDTYYCLLDKPNGIISYRLRDYSKRMKIFVFDEGVTSLTKETKETSISLLKKNNVGIIKAGNFSYKLIYPKVTEINPLENTVDKIGWGKNFVVIFKNQFKNDDLNNFENLLIEKNINFCVVKDKNLYYKNGKLSYNYEFIDLLIKLEIRNIYYCGYYLNNEILLSNFGITQLYIKKRYSGLFDLPMIYIINDLSYIIQSASIEPDIEKAVIINHCRGGVKNILSSTLLKELSQGVSESISTRLEHKKYYILFKDLNSNIKTAIVRSLKLNNIRLRHAKIIFVLFFLIIFFLILIIFKI